MENLNSLKNPREAVDQLLIIHKEEIQEIFMEIKWARI